MAGSPDFTNDSSLDWSASYRFNQQRGITSVCALPGQKELANYHASLRGTHFLSRPYTLQEQGRPQASDPESRKHPHGHKGRRLTRGSCGLFLHFIKPTLIPRPGKTYRKMTGAGQVVLDPAYRLGSRSKSFQSLLVMNNRAALQVGGTMLGCKQLVLCSTRAKPNIRKFRPEKSP